MAQLDKLVITAKKLIDKFGKTLTVTRRGNGGYDPSTLENKKQPNEVQSTKVTPPEKLTKEYIDAETGIKGMVQTYASPELLTNWVPSKGDLANIDGEEWQILKVITHYSGDLIVLYQYILGR